MPLVRAILRGIRDTGIVEAKAVKEEEEFAGLIKALGSQHRRRQLSS